MNGSLDGYPASHSFTYSSLCRSILPSINSSIILPFIIHPSTKHPSSIHLPFTHPIVNPFMNEYIHLSIYHPHMYSSIQPSSRHSLTHHPSTHSPIHPLNRSCIPKPPPRGIRFLPALDQDSSSVMLLAGLAGTTSLHLGLTWATAHTSRHGRRRCRRQIGTSKPCISGRHIRGVEPNLA